MEVVPASGGSAWSSTASAPHAASAAAIILRFNDLWFIIVVLWLLLALVESAVATVTTALSLIPVVLLIPPIVPVIWMASLSPSATAAASGALETSSLLRKWINWLISLVFVRPSV